ncbi:MAG: hypothetical protein LUI12_05060 [Clostridiales bacterium]|nr:hypothetical protein [Clostridiales bacterium]
MLILEDTRQQESKHENKHKYFREHGIQWTRTKLYCGDYTLPTNQSVCIDSKQSIMELLNDIQVKTISKTELEKNISQISEKYNIIGFKQSLIRDVIWEDDIDRNVEQQINDLCFANNVPERAISDFQALYVKRRGFFHRGLKRAQNSGIKLYILVEDATIRSIDDVFSWVNPRLKIMIPDKTQPPKYITKNGRPVYARKQKYPKATRGKQLALSLITMEKKYNVTFKFCRPDESGAEIVRLLTETEGKEWVNGREQRKNCRQKALMYY